MKVFHTSKNRTQIIEGIERTMPHLTNREVHSFLEDQGLPTALGTVKVVRSEYRRRHRTITMPDVTGVQVEVSERTLERLGYRRIA